MNGTNFTVGGIGLLSALSFTMVVDGCASCPSEPKCKDSELELVSGASNNPGTNGSTDGGRSDGTLGVSDIVASEDFENGYSPTGDWQVDNTAGTISGMRAVHPPTLKAGQSAAMIFDCNGKSHTQFAFSLQQIVGQETNCCAALPTSAIGLELWVDDVLRETFGNFGKIGGGSFLIDVSDAQHTYKFVASTQQDIDPPFLLDNFICREDAPSPSPDGRVDFDRRFVPPETTGWFVDNTRGALAGEAAIHPPAMHAGDNREMRFDCGAKPHSQLTFALQQLVGQETNCCAALPTSTVGLDLLVDGTLRKTFGAFGKVGGGTFTITVEPASHVYTFTARTLQDVTPPFVLDTFVCE